MVEVLWRMKCPHCGVYMEKKSPLEKWYCHNCKWEEKESLCHG